MKTKVSILVAAVLLAVVTFPARAGAQALAGLWDATVVVNGGVEIPFRMELAGSGSSVKGSLSAIGRAPVWAHGNDPPKALGGSRGLGCGRGGR